MTAVLIVRVGNSVVGACTRPCYEAKHKPCRCICCALNHGVGEDQALANARSHAAEWAARARAEGWEFDTSELGPRVLQHALF